MISVDELPKMKWQLHGIVDKMDPIKLFSDSLEDLCAYVLNLQKLRRKIISIKILPLR